MLVSKWKPILILALSLTASAISQANSEGHESGGGGGIVLVNNTPLLIDFFNLKITREQLEELYKDSTSSKRNASLQSHREILNDRDPAFEQATLLMSTWIDSYYKKMNISPSKLIINSMDWNFTKAMQFTNSHYRPSIIPEEKIIHTAAYYYNSTPKREVKVVLGIWNSMSSVDQIGLVLHEMLRNYQLGFKQNINDEILQKSTAMMIYCKPEHKNINYLLSLLSPIYKNKAAYLSKYDKVIAKCRSN